METFHFDLAWSLPPPPPPCVDVQPSAAGCRTVLVLLPGPVMMMGDRNTVITMDSGLLPMFAAAGSGSWGRSAMPPAPSRRGQGSLPTFGERTEQAAKQIAPSRGLRAVAAPPPSPGPIQRPAAIPASSGLGPLPPFGERTEQAAKMIEKNALDVSDKTTLPEATSAVQSREGSPPRTDKMQEMQPDSRSKSVVVQCKSALSNRKRRSGQRAGWCALCCNNGEMPRVYRSHSLHTRLSDGTLIVTCPVLRRLTCEYCGATGDFAHTRTRCPQASQSPPLAKLLKQTPRRCDGTLRLWN